jgi:putative SOS response-associated peptidase YedK
MKLRNEDRPLCTLGGPNSGGIAAPNPSLSPAPHLVCGFLTTAPSAIVEPIHPKAMPVILTTDEERDV